MTDAERERLAGYLRNLADRMGLKDWAVEVLEEWADDDAHAEVRCVDGRKLAKVKFARDWGEQTPEVLRHTCCHETIHCHHAPLRAEMYRRLNKADFATFMMLLEYATDGMADAWAPLLPLMLTNLITAETPPMGRQRPKPSATPKTAQPKPKAGPKPAPTTKPKKG